MLIIKVKEDKNGIEKALKIYKSKIIKTRQMSELNERRDYEKGSVKRRREKKKAIYVNKKYKNQE